VSNEYYLTIAANPEQGSAPLVSLTSGLPSFVTAVSDGEVWLKAPDSQNGWEYDVRLVRLTEYRWLVEVAASTSAFWSDVAALVHILGDKWTASLADDDGEPVVFRRNRS
jgi:hypothetical protein